MKKQKREIKYKNIFGDGESAEQSHEEQAVQAPPPPPPPKQAVAVQERQPVIEKLVIDEQVKQEPVLAQELPKQVPKEAPKITVPTPVSQYHPVQTQPKNDETHVTPTPVTRLAQEIKASPVASIDASKGEAGTTDKKKSKIEELKSKYLKKPDQKPAPIPIAQPVQVKPSSPPPPPLPLVPKVTEVPTPPPALPKSLPTTVAPEPAEVAPSDAFQHFLNFSSASQAPTKPIFQAPKEQQVQGRADNWNMINYFRTDSPAEIHESDGIVHKQSSDSIGGQSPKPLQIEAELNSPVHRYHPTVIVKPPPPPLAVRKPRRELGVYREEPSKSATQQSSPLDSHSMGRVPLFTNQNSSPPELSQQYSSEADQAVDQLSQTNIRRIKHTLSIAESPVNSPLQKEDFCFPATAHPQVAELSAQHVCELDFLNNFPKLVDDIKKDRLIDEHCHHIIRHTITAKSATEQQQTWVHPPVEERADSKIHFEFSAQANGLSEEELSSRWLRSFFESFILYSREIQPDAEAFSYHFLTSVFNIGELSSAFIISLIKTSKVHYAKHEEELLKNIVRSVRKIHEHRHWVTEAKLAEFIGFVLERLRNYYSGDQYCRVFVELAYSFPKAVVSNEEAIACFSRECQQFSYHALLLWLMTAHPQFTTLKNLTVVLSSVIKDFGTKGYNEQCLTLLDSVSTKMGSQAYPVLRELRSRVVGKIEAKEEQSKKSSVGGMFGGLLSQAMKLMNNPSKVVTPTRDQIEPPEQKQDIWYDPEKKRYVLKGQIPEDEEDSKPKSNIPAPPPPPRPTQHSAPPSQPVSDPSSERTFGVPLPRRGGNRIPHNRYVSS